MPFARRIRWMTLARPFLFTLLACVTCAAPALGQARPENPLAGKNVLVLNAFESNIPAFQKTNQGLSNALQSGGIGIRNQFYEHLDLARHADPESRRLLVELMRRRHNQRKFDFIITLYPEALEFLLGQGREVFSDAPVIALYLPQGFVVPDAGRRIIPHPVIPDVKRTIEIALKLVPKAERVYVVSGAHPLDKWLENLARRDFGAWEDRLEFQYLSHLPLEEMLTTVARAPSGNIVFINTIGRDVSGKWLTTVEVGRQIARVSNSPVFGILDTLLGNGIVGGSVISFEHVGSRAGETVLEILRGTRVGKDVPNVLEVPQLNAFDWRQVRHWNLDEGALPKGSIIINREFTLWDLRHYMAGGLAFIIAQSGLITGLLVQRRRRRSAEASLRAAEEKYRTLFTSALEGIYETSPQGQFLTVNPALAKMLGYDSPEEVISSVRDVAHQVWADPNERADYLRLLDQQNVTRGHECQFLRKDGTKFWVSLHTRRVPGPDGQALRYTGFAEDITERKLAEQAVEERLRFEVMLSNISSGFVNLSPEEIESEIHRALHSITEFFDADRCSIGLFSEHGNQLVLAFEYHLPQVEPAPQSLSQEQMPWYLEQLKQGKPVVVNRLEDFPAEAKNERRLCMAKGMKSLLSIPMASGGRPLGSCALVSTRSERVWPEELVQRFRLLSDVFVNALERRRVEESLRQKTEELDRFFSINLDLLAIANTDGYFLRLNPAWEKTLGYRREELRSLRFLDLVHPDDLQSTREAVSLLATQKKITHFENRYRCKDGNYRWMEWTAAPAGNLIYAIARDITDRLKAEAEAREHLDQLAHVTRLGIMGELTSSLAHEINQPLTAIQSNAEAAQRFLSGSAQDIGEVRMILEDILRDNKRASDIIRRIRTMVKREAIALAPVDPNDLIREVLGLVRADSLLRDLSISTRLSPGLPPVSGDRVQLQQVILNLIMNGAAAMKNTPPPQRELTIRTEVQGNRAVKVSVIDLGTGIDEHDTERLFETFYTTKSGGMGMGLPISRTIVRAHGGTMGASNNPEGGATFFFTLPTSDGDPS